MFRHVVLLTFRPDAPEGLAGEVVARLRELPPLIPELRSYRVQVDAGLSEGNAHVGVVADFDDRAGWETYRDHPDHVAVIAELIAPHLASRTAIQMDPA